MSLATAIAAIKSQLEQVANREQANQQERAAIEQRVEQLKIELQEKQSRQSQLDEEAIQLYTQAESLKLKLAKLERIAQLSQEFQNLQLECQQDVDLLAALHTAISETPKVEINSYSQDTSQPHLNLTGDRLPTIETIKQTLPNAEKIYQQLVTKYLETYQTYQNFLVDGLDLIWCSLAFITFGRASYRQMCLKFHPDLQGSERSMQLINTAWEIAGQYLENLETTNSATTL